MFFVIATAILVGIATGYIVSAIAALWVEYPPESASDAIEMGGISLLGVVMVVLLWTVLLSL